MANSFDSVFEALKKTSEGLVLATNGLIHANEGFKDVIDTILAAHEEHEDLRETIHRLEGLVISLDDKVQIQGQELRALRDRLEGGR